MQTSKNNEVSFLLKGAFETFAVQLTGECTINAKDIATTLRKETEKRKRVYPE